MKGKNLLVHVPHLTWLIAWSGTTGSLFFSEIWRLPPCVLCWYQRICLYPLVVIIAVGILTKDYKKLPYYVLPFSITGIAISIYHNLLYYNILSESIAPCHAGISCTTKYFEWFGFVTIPFLSFMSFLTITILMALLLWQNNKSAKKSSSAQKILKLK